MATTPVKWNNVKKPTKDDWKQQGESAPKPSAPKESDKK